MSKLVKVYESLSLRVQGLLPRQCPRDEVLDDVWTVTENTEEDEDEELSLSHQHHRSLRLLGLVLFKNEIECYLKNSVNVAPKSK